MISLDERGKQCPIPIVDTKKALEPLGVGEVVETVVDNEISAQNLKKFADQRQYAYKGTATFNEQDYQACGIPAAAPQGYIVVISSDSMGEPEKELGKILLKGFLFALSKKEDVPKKIIFYNGGARLTCEGSESLDDLRELEKSGAEIATCGTCLKFQNLEDKLKVGGVTNMYEITEALTGPYRVVKPC